jgi:pilus assembly protein Flp/PilA
MKILTTPSGKKQKGATMVEYGIMVALIAVISITTIGTLGNKVNSTFNTVQNKLP